MPIGRIALPIPKFLFFDAPHPFSKGGMDAQLPPRPVTAVTASFQASSFNMPPLF
jgi:hypothetical protein